MMTCQTKKPTLGGRTPFVFSGQMKFSKTFQPKFTPVLARKSKSSELFRQSSPCSSINAMGSKILPPHPLRLVRAKYKCHT
jgi:hypothetical protein